ncbi:MAG TPA: hypothetical protein PKK89_12410 [Microthrixaceae bacterium]|nr:hypothetical protein [Microthrixaceae bacterium]
MSRRLEIELTSERPDGTWTWRAAGAKLPKGDLSGSLLPGGSKVGDVLRAEAEFLIDGIDIVEVLAPKGTRKQPELLEIMGSGREEPLVTTQLVSRGRGEGRGRRRDRDGDGPRRERRDRGDRPDRPRGPRPEVPERPKPKRLRPGRAHRNAVIAAVPEEQRAIAEQVLRGGVPAVREAVVAQNEQARTENRPEQPVDQVVAMAESLYPRLRDAEWKDRAAAAIADLDELDLRDLRSVVVAGDGASHDEEARAMLEELRTGLTRRVDEEHANWVADIAANLDAGRFVRALRLSSRPPKAGTPVPTELSARLVTAVSEGLTPGTNQELWAAALDALAFSPVRQQVTPAGRPETPTDDLLEAVRRVADRVPAIAALFGVDPSEAAAAKRRRPPRGRSGAGRGAKPGDKSSTGSGKTADDKTADDAASDDAASAGTADAEAVVEVAEAETAPTEPVQAESDQAESDQAESDQAESDQAGSASSED